MPRCSVCQTRYTAQKTERCPRCGWDVQAVSFVTGIIPEVAQKESIRLEWAKQLWSKAKLQQDQLRQFQIQLEAALDREKLLQSQLNQQKTEFAGALQQHETAIAALKAKLEAELKAELAQVPPVQFEVEAIQPSEPLPDLSELSEISIQPPERLPEPPKIDIQVPEFLSPERSPNILFFAAPERSLKPFQFESVTIRAERQETQQHQTLYSEESLEAGISLEMVQIPGGSFEMGSPETECGRDLHESPQHWVQISPFALSRFLITQAQWKAIAVLPKIQRALNLYPADFEGDERPVEQISWYDAIEFCDRLTHKTGQTYRLPSEAEWEYACRAGTTTPFHFGETITSDLANYDGSYTYGCEAPGIYRQETTTRLSIANAFGLSDMHGNLWEWCADAWHDTYDGAPNDGQVWEAEEGATYRVLRGGAWYCLPELCRSAQRHWNQPDMAGSGIGFRVVCAA